MSLQKYSFWKRWLLHSLVIWLIATILSFGNFLYKRSIWGNYLYYSDGRPVTALDRFTDIFFNTETAFLILGGILLIEINYHYFFKKKTWVFIAGSLATGLAIESILLCHYFLLHGSANLFSFETVFLLTLYALFYPLLLERIHKRIFKAERLYEQSRIELNTLKAQINPHFFFNALNGLYGTSLREGAKDTASGIERLANLMRYVLTEGSADFVPVSSEIKFLKEYIELQQLRLPAHENIEVKTNITYDEQHAVIAPLLLVPLLENAFKYGISMENKSFIMLRLLIEEGNLELLLQNSIVTPITYGTGIGIVHVKRRLALLYPERHKFEITQTATTYTILLRIHL